MYSDNVKTMDAAAGVRFAAVGFARGLLAAVVFTLITFALFACLLAYTALTENAVPVIATAVQAAGALISGYCTAKKTGSRGFLSGLAAGVLYVLILWVIAFFASDAYSMGAHFFKMLAFSAFGGAVGGVLGVNLKAGKSNRRKR